jgi:hypothetical protein
VVCVKNGVLHPILHGFYEKMADFCGFLVFLWPLGVIF